MNDKIKYFFPKVFNRLASEKNRIWEHLPVEKISLWGMGHVPSKDEFIGRLQRMLGEFTPEFFNGIANEDKESIIRCANQTMKHDFELLGSGLMHLDPIPWHSDFKTGYEWPKGVFYRKLPKISAGSDLKMPRELSRCHQLLWLGEAYLISGDDKYAQDVLDEINNWIDENPLMYSVNWECSMDVAIRAINLMYALDFIAGSEYFTDEFAAKVYRSLYQHGFFIRNNLEKTIPFSNNHYMSDIIGLLYLGELFRDTYKGKCWLRFALKEFKKETLIQIMPSGVNFERSVSYHRLTSELLLYSYYMLERCGINVSKDVSDRLEQMVAYVANYTKSNGLSPLVADNDDGRLLPFINKDFRMHDYLTTESTEMRIVANGVSRNEIWGPFKKESKCYKDANVAILRKGTSYLFTSCCDRWRYDKNTGVFVGVHLHNDLLSFEYSVGNDDIIVDPGAYLYTSDIGKRNEFRSTRKHNTIIIDGEEQNILSPNSAFSLKYNSTARGFDFSEASDKDECIGEYSTIVGQMTHSRKFELREDGLIITDIIIKQGIGHSAYMSFHLAEGVSVGQFDDVLQLTQGNSIVNMDFQTNYPYKVYVFDDTVSPSFGVIRLSKTVSLSFEFNDTAEIVTKFSVKQ